MARANSNRTSAALDKQLLRLLQFGHGRKLVLKSRQDELWFEEEGATGTKCRISASALQQGISSGLFIIGAAGQLVERKEALAFRNRQELASREPKQPVFSGQHQQMERIMVLEGGVAYPRLINRAVSPLSALERLRSGDGSAYFARGLILAGEMLANDFNRGQLQPQITSRWQPRLNCSHGSARNHSCDLSDIALQARQRFNRAVAAVGPELSGVVIDAICFEKGLELIERERQWPARSAKLMLRTGLEILARHYQPQSSSPAAMRSWAEPDVS